MTCRIYLEELAPQAEQRHHTTTIQAATLALRAGVSRLIIGHYSSRSRDIAAYEAECRTVFPDTVAASDGDVFEIGK